MGSRTQRPLRFTRERGSEPSRDRCGWGWPRSIAVTSLLRRTFEAALSQESRQTRWTAWVKPSGGRATGPTCDASIHYERWLAFQALQARDNQNAEAPEVFRQELTCNVVRIARHYVGRRSGHLVVRSDRTSCRSAEGPNVDRRFRHTSKS